MKTDLRMMCKKIGFIFLILGFFTIVETVISKGTSQLRVDTQRSPEVSVKGNIVVEQKPMQLPEGTLSLEQIHAVSQGDIGTIRSTRSTLTALPVTDKFTQSQAHMSLPEIKKLIEKEHNTKHYTKLIDAILQKEKQYQDDYVFYHGMDNVWRVPQDLYTRLYIHFKKLPENIMQQFIFLRFEEARGPSAVQAFLVNELKEKGLINDHGLSNFLYAVNIALFGNIGVDPECTWQYFVKSRGHMKPDRQIYEKILNTFGLTQQYVNELMALTKLYETKEETIVQIFVPKNEVDQIGYLSWVRGIPAHKKTMDMVLCSVQDKKFEKTAPALDYYTKIFKDEQEENPIFSNLLDRVRMGDFGLSYFLKFYRNYPEKIEDINNFQARLIFTPELLLNPLSGVKIFRYSTATVEQIKRYQQKFDEIFKKIIAEKIINN